MRHYLFSLLTGFTAPFLALALLFALSFGRPCAQSRWIHEFYQVKDAYASSHQGPKILLAGGSSALFGLSAEKMEEALGIPVVNYGVAAGLQLDYTLHRTQKLLRPGDTVILALEYSLYHDGNKWDSVLVDYITSYDTLYFRQLPIVTQLRIAASMGFKGLWARVRKLPCEDHYPLSELTHRGDYRYGGDWPGLEKRQRQLSRLRPEAHGLRFDPTGTAWTTLDRYLQWASNNGVRVLATFPGYLHFEEYGNEEEKAFFHHLCRFYESRAIPLLGTPEEFMFPLSHFYDTRYHLNADGVDRRTNQVIHHFGRIIPDRVLIRGLI